MEIKKRILDSSEALFFKYGIKGVSMDDIATELGISKKTIYQHFSDKDGIVLAVFSRHIEAEKSESITAQQQAKDPIQEIFFASESIRKNLTDINPSVLLDLKKYYPVSWDLFQKFKSEHFLGLIISNLKTGIETQLYRPEIDVEILARLRLEQVDLGFDGKIFPPAQFKMLDIQLAFLDHFLHGILTASGLALYNQYKKQL